MLKTIIISGKSGHGKDMSAYFMEKELEAHGKKVMVIHFADVLKYFLTEFYHWDGDKNKPENRTLLQHVGTDMVRAKIPDYWTCIVMGFLNAQEDYSDFDVALVPDARFENEVNILLEYLTDVTTVRINRTNSDGSVWLNPQLTEDQRHHPSETSLDNYVFDYTIINDEGIDTLKESCITVLQDLNMI